MGKFTKSNQSILKDGDIDWYGHQSMGGVGTDNSGKRITNALDPTLDNDYSTKNYFDSHNHDGEYYPTGESPKWTTSKTTNGYQTWPGGWTIQWGRVNASLVQHWTFVSVTFAVTFADIPFNLMATAENRINPVDGEPWLGQDPTESNLSFYNVTKTGATIDIKRNLGNYGLDGGQATPFYIRWTAIGYI